MIKFLSAIVALILTFFIVSSAHPDVYRYVDEAGVVHFTDSPTDKRFELIIKDRVEPPKPPPPPSQVEGAVPQEAGGEMDGMIAEASLRYGLDPSLIKAMIKVESNFNARAISPKGALGLMQLMPYTAYAMGVANPFNPGDNIEAGVRHLNDLLNLFQGNLTLALAAYNAGKDVVLKYGGIPPFKETRDYVRRVLETLRLYRANSRK